MLTTDTATEERYRVLDAVSTVHGSIVHMRVEGEAPGWHAVVSTNDVANLAKLGTCPQEIATFGASCLIGAEFTALPVDAEWVMLPGAPADIVCRGPLVSAH